MFLCICWFFGGAQRHCQTCPGGRGVGLAAGRAARRWMPNGREGSGMERGGLSANGAFKHWKGARCALGCPRKGGAGALGPRRMDFAVLAIWVFNPEAAFGPSVPAFPNALGGSRLRSCPREPATLAVPKSRAGDLGLLRRGKGRCEAALRVERRRPRGRWQEARWLPWSRAVPPRRP